MLNYSKDISINLSLASEVNLYFSDENMLNVVIGMREHDICK